MRSPSLCGQPPRPESFVFKTASGSSSIVLDLRDASGNTIKTATIAPSATAKTLVTLLGTDWSTAIAGFLVLSVSTADTYYNNSGTLQADGTVAIKEQPTTSSAVLPIGDYRDNPWRGGMVY